MEIFNKSKRTFMLSNGNLEPEQSITISDVEGNLLLGMYKDELIQIGNSKIEKENAELKAKVAELEEIAISPAKVNKKRK